MPQELPDRLRDRTFTRCFTDQARRTPDRVAIRFYGTDITYAELDEYSDRFAGWLHRNGVAAGDRVGVFMPNCPQFLVLMLGTLKAGAVHVPVNPMFKRGELEYEADDAQISILVAASHLVSTVAGATFQTVREIVPVDLQELVPAEPTMPLPEILRSHTAAPHEMPSRWQELVTGPVVESRREDPDALAALNYTGGTTGLPKGCRHTQRNMVYAGANCAAAWGIMPEAADDPTHETVMSHTPVFWISGENTGVLAPLLSGATVVLLARWDVDAALSAIERYRVTAMSGVVENYLELLDAAKTDARDLTSLQHLRCMSFSQRLSVDIRRRWDLQTAGAGILREAGYGMTESHTSNTFTTGMQEGDLDLSSEPVFCGLPMPGTDVLILDPVTREPLPMGETGEIAIHTPAAFDGYWRAPQASAEVTHHGWLLTGDTGKLSEQGYLHYLGREKDMIKVNGMSVFPSEVEHLMSRHPSIQAVAVVGVPHETRGQEVVAYVELRRGHDLDSGTLRAWADEHMATYKVPTMRVLPALPMTATGKVHKSRLIARPRTWAELTVGQSLGEFWPAFTTDQAWQYADAADPAHTVYTDGTRPPLSLNTLHAVKALVDLPLGTVHGKETVVFHGLAAPGEPGRVQMTVADKQIRRGKRHLVLEYQAFSGQVHTLSAFKTFVFPGHTDEPDREPQVASDLGLFADQREIQDEFEIADSLDFAVTQPLLDAFGGATATAGPAHTDPVAAREMFGGTILQGMYVFERAAQVMAGLSSLPDWARSGRLTAKFVGNVLAGDAVTLHTRIHEAGGRARCEFTAHTGDGTTIFVAVGDGPLDRSRLQNRSEA